MVKLYIVAYKVKDPTEPSHSYVIDDKNAKMKDIFANKGFINYGKYGIILDSHFDVIGSWEGKRVRTTIGATIKYGL